MSTSFPSPSSSSSIVNQFADSDYAMISCNPCGRSAVLFIKLYPKNVHSLARFQACPSRGQYMLNPHLMTCRSLSSTSSRWAESTTRISPNPRVNPPSSCRPAPFEAPKMGQDESRMSWLWNTGRAYFGFYKTGIKNILENRRRNRLFWAQVQAEGTQSVTRSELQVMTRHKHDMARIPLFGVCLVVFGEFLPLLMFALGKRVVPILPHTVRLPSQMFIMYEDARLWVIKKLDEVAMLETAAAADPEMAPNFSQQREMNKYFTEYITRYSNLRSPWLPVSLQRNLIEDHLKYLLVDSELLNRDGGVEGLEDQEVRLALFERGYPHARGNIEMLRMNLKKDMMMRIEEAQKWPNDKVEGTR